MSIEDTLDRIATALERIAALPNNTLNQIRLEEPPAPAGDGLSSNTPADAPKKVVRLARSVATDPGVVAAQARDKAAAEAAAAKPAAPVNGSATNGAAPKVVSFEEMRNGLVGVKVKLGADVSRSVMGKVGAANVQEIKPEDFGKVVAECARLMG